MADFTIKRGDTAPALTAVLADTDGPLDLSTATTIALKLKADAGLVQAGPVEITNAAGGAVRYEWENDDLVAAGTYNGEFEIAWADGTIETVPNDSYFTVLVMEDLG